MLDWTQEVVATVPITVDGRALSVELLVGVDAADAGFRAAGRASVEGDSVIFEGPPCFFTLAYRVRETGQGGPVGRHGLCQPRGRVALGIVAEYERAS